MPWTDLSSRRLHSPVETIVVSKSFQKYGRRPSYILLPQLLISLDLHSIWFVDAREKSISSVLLQAHMDLRIWSRSCMSELTYYNFVSVPPGA